MDGKIHLVIDTDPGQGDVAAILMAYSLAKRELISFMVFTAVVGNVGLNHMPANARIVCDWTGRKDFPVYTGVGKPLLRDLATAEEIHSKTGLDGVALHDPKCPLQSVHAIDCLIRVFHGAKRGSVMLCSVGPLANTALAFSLAPDITDAVKSIALMDGCHFEAGSITPCAEFNFYVNPHAAQIVLQSGASITILPLDVTHKTQITTPRMDMLRRLGNVSGLRLMDILQGYERHDIQAFGLEGGPLHDPCAMAFAVLPELLRGKAYRADVDTQSELSLDVCLVDWRGTADKPANALWVTEVDPDGLLRELAEPVSFLS